MDKYIAALLQLMIWSGFTVVEWLSERDQLTPKVILFAVFFYLAFLLARMIVKSNKTTLLVTMASLGAYGALHLALQYLSPIHFFA